MAGNFNKVLGTQTQGLTRLHTDCGLTDAALNHHGHTDFTTYQRGNQVIDYIRVDKNILRCIQSVGYEPFNMHITSDHRGVFINIATSQCFGSSILPLQPLQLRDLTTKWSHQIAPYFDHKEQHLLDHKWYQKIDRLKQHMHDYDPNHELAKDLYNRLISSAVYAGSKLKRFPPAPYSPTIARLRNIQCLLKLVVTQHKMSRDMTENIARTKATLGDAGYTLPGTQEECILALARATRQLKAAIAEEVQSQHLRQQHQNNLIQLHEATGNSKMAKKLRGMQRAEQTKRVFLK